jgi:hypothetical protein
MKWHRRGGIRDPRNYLWEASSQSVEWGREGTREVRSECVWLV